MPQNGRRRTDLRGLLESRLAETYNLVRSSKKILASYAKAPGCKSVRLTIRRETDNLLSSLGASCRILRELRRMDAEELDFLRTENEELKNKNRKLAIELRDALGVRVASDDLGDGAPQPQSAKYPGRRAVGLRPRGAPKGHRGNTRSIPDKWDEEIDVPPPGFCECGCAQILEDGCADIKYIEDIPPVSRRVTRIRYKRGICAMCRDIRHPEAAGAAVEIGGNLASHLSMMRQAGMTYRKLSLFCTETLGIPLSPSGAMGVANRVADMNLPLYDSIGAALPHQMVLYGDETGWKVRGSRWYVWIICNASLAYFHPDKSRASQVPRNLLGGDYAGTVVCDFYGAYNFLTTQRCLEHFARDIKKEREVLPGSVELERFEERVWRFIWAGTEIAPLPEGIEKDKKVKELSRELDSISKIRVPSGRPLTLQKRIKKYRDDMMRFVTTPGVDWHNNRSERTLRPMVISRKMSFGSDTPDGARRTAVLHSVVETCRLQNISPVKLLKEKMIRGRTGDCPLTQLLTSKLKC